MNYLKSTLALFVALLASVFCINQAQANYAYRSDVQYFMQEMQRKHGFSQNYLTSLFSDAQLQTSIVRIMTPKPKPPSGKTSYTPWYKYRKRFVNSTRINQGIQFRRDYASALERAERTFGVPAKYIAAIIGVETNYGRNMGNYRVIDALTTMTFDSPRRRDFYRGELEAYLLMLKEQKLNPNYLYGSYAGALGYGQFMPSSYRRYAVDFDGDGKINIWDNPVDAIGSVANYFKQHGWVPGDTVVVRAYANSYYDASSANDKERRPNQSVAQLRAKGFTPAMPLPDSRMANLVELRGAGGKEHWFALQNFFVITEYNNTRRYAMSVYDLAQEIEAGYRFSNF